MRPSGRQADELRPIQIIRRYTKHAEGSVLIRLGETHVLCTASIEERVPHFLRGKNRGWVTAEYAMLPRATQTRSERDGVRGRTNSRAQEIQRLIGRSLRAVVDTTALGERTVILDCDVLQADGGTRVAAVTGCYVALADAIEFLVRHKRLSASPIHGSVAAVSVGIYRGQIILDLDYAEDAEAESDVNVVMNELGALVEIQGTAEGHAFHRKELEQMLDLAEQGTRIMLQAQATSLGKQV
ncbi:MAG: ribonuclease PH [Gammaproteobacteria bacterium]